MVISKTVEFIIPGAAVPKARPRARIARIGGRDVPRMYEPEKSVRYEGSVGWTYRQECKDPPATTPVGVTVLSFHSIPKSWSKRRKQNVECQQIAVEKKPDLDNIVKSILDGLNGVAFADDKQVWCLSAQKRYSLYPHTYVRVDFYEEGNPQ